MKLAAFGLIALTASGQFIFRVPSSGGDDLPACTSTISSGTNLDTTIGAAANGAVICLNSGTYSTGTTINGNTKSPVVTVRPADSASVTLSNLAFTGTNNGVEFRALDANRFTVPGFDMLSGTHSNILLSGMTITSNVNIEVNMPATVIAERFSQNNIENPGGSGTPQRWLFYTTSGTQNMIIRDCEMVGGSADGVRFGGPGGGHVEDCLFQDIAENEICSVEVCHTDAIQDYGGSNWTVKGSYFKDNVVGIAAYDGTENNLIEDTIFDNGSQGRAWFIEMYSCDDCVTNHNTLLYRAGCSGGSCGFIDYNKKPADNNGTGGVITNNIASGLVIASNTITTNTNNLLRSGASGGNVSGSPTYTGGSLPSTVGGFLLSGGSLGKNGATDGSDIGARIDDVMAYLPSQAERFLHALGLRQAPTLPGLSASLVSWKAHVARKYGRHSEARMWSTTLAQLSMANAYGSL